MDNKELSQHIKPSGEGMTVLAVVIICIGVVSGFIFYNVFHEIKVGRFGLETVTNPTASGWYLLSFCHP